MPAEGGDDQRPTQDLSNYCLRAGIPDEVMRCDFPRTRVMNCTLCCRYRVDVSAPMQGKEPGDDFLFRVGFRRECQLNESAGD
jgi:hypothetical protein